MSASLPHSLSSRPLSVTSLRAHNCCSVLQLSGPWDNACAFLLPTLSAPGHGTAQSSPLDDLGLEERGRPLCTVSSSGEEASSASLFLLRDMYSLTCTQNPGTCMARVLIMCNQDLEACTLAGKKTGWGWGGVCLSYKGSSAICHPVCRNPSLRPLPHLLWWALSVLGFKRKGLAFPKCPLQAWSFELMELNELANLSLSRRRLAEVGLPLSRSGLCP